VSLCGADKAVFDALLCIWLTGRRIHGAAKSFNLAKLTQSFQVATLEHLTIQSGIFSF